MEFIVKYLAFNKLFVINMLQLLSAIKGLQIKSTWMPKFSSVKLLLFF